MESEEPMRRYIDWVPYQRPKISNRCPAHLRDQVFAENEDLLMKYARMTDDEVRIDMENQ